jgi:hypothetical protein
MMADPVDRQKYAAAVEEMKMNPGVPYKLLLSSGQVITLVSR